VKKPKASSADGPAKMIRDSAAVFDTDDESEASMKDLLAETIEASNDGNPGFDYESLRLNEENLVWINGLFQTESAPIKISTKYQPRNKPSLLRSSKCLPRD
jgi:hypothetical protein